MGSAAAALDWVVLRTALNVQTQELPGAHIVVLLGSRDAGADAAWKILVPPGMDRRGLVLWAAWVLGVRHVRKA
ncbi:MAG: hypothetical protein WCH44_11220 [Betaproteobacteria bacterium]